MLWSETVLVLPYPTIKIYLQSILCCVAFTIYRQSKSKMFGTSKQYISNFNFIVIVLHSCELYEMFWNVHGSKTILNLLFVI